MKRSIFLILFSLFSISSFSQQYNFTKDYYGNITAKDIYGNVVANGSSDNSGNFVWKDLNGNILYTLTQNSSGSVTQKDRDGNIISTYEKTKSPVADVLDVRSYQGNPAAGGGFSTGIDLSQAFNAFNNLAIARRNYNYANRERQPQYETKSNSQLFGERQDLISRAFLLKETNKTQYRDLLYKALAITDFDGLSSYYLSKYWIEDNSFPVAQGYINAAINKNKKDADFLALKSYIELQLKNIPLSKKFYQKALKLNKLSVLKYNFVFP